MEEKLAKARRPIWDYLFYDKKLPDKPEVLHIAAAVAEEMIGHDRFWVAGCLMNFWGWVDDQFPDGFLRSISVRNLFAIRSYLTEPFVRGMIEVGWLVVEADGVRIPNSDRWLGPTAKRRFQERQRVWNNRHKPTVCTQDVRNECEQEANKIVALSPKSPIPSPSPIPASEEDKDTSVSAEDFALEWNKYTAFCHIREMTNKREAALKARLGKPAWRDSWKEALARMSRSPFCCGSEGWKANVDWFLRPDTLTKVMEGNYDDRHGRGVGPSSRIYADEEKYVGVSQPLRETPEDPQGAEPSLPLEGVPPRGSDHASPAAENP